jgi:hypothetical protein
MMWKPTTLWLVGAAFLMSMPAQAYKLLGNQWDPDDGPVPYAVDPAGSDDIDDGSDVDTVDDAYRAWACVEGSALRFEKSESDGPRQMDPGDGVNTFFFSETEDEARGNGMGPGTLGITVGAAGQGADITLNGYDHEWSAGYPIRGADIMSTSLHEVGHLLGLAHPCEDENDLSTCLNSSVTVMHPNDQTPVVRPLSDDIEGLLSMYASNDDSRCKGPFRIGEKCDTACDCLPGLRCAPDSDGNPICTPPCSSEDVDCPRNFNCLLQGRGDQGGIALGICIRYAEGAKRPPAAICQVDAECESGVCLAIPALGRTACRRTCDDNDDCPETYGCEDGVCLYGGDIDGIPCPDEINPGCGCTQGAGPEGLLPFVVMAFAFFLWACRRRGRWGTLGQDVRSA